MKNKVLLVLSVLFLSVPSVWAATAKAVIAGTVGGSNVSGEVLLSERSGGVYVEAVVSNLPPGKHGFHIHEKGSCADSGKAAGGHFNPDNVAHGYVPKDGMTHAHPGDMGNIEANAKGKGILKIFLPGVSLTEGKYLIVGKSMIVHEKEDDFSQPVGNAGDRVGCGIITAVEEKE